MNIRLKRLRIRRQDYLDLRRRFREVNELSESRDLIYKKKGKRSRRKILEKKDVLYITVRDSV